MIIQQLSVFLENKSGRLSDVSSILAQADINMTAFSIADTSDFGILRAIVSDPQKALNILKENNFSASLTEVVCLICPNKPGAMSKALNILNNGGIQIEYMYAFAMGDSANIVIRPANVQKCINILQEHEMELRKASDVCKF